MGSKQEMIAKSSHIRDWHVLKGGAQSKYLNVRHIPLHMLFHNNGDGYYNKHICKQLAGEGVSIFTYKKYVTVINKSTHQVSATN
jgi:hypothetical protein